jgi:hypothetical protein
MASITVFNSATIWLLILRENRDYVVQRQRATRCHQQTLDDHLYFIINITHDYFEAIQD